MNRPDVEGILAEPEYFNKGHEEAVVALCTYILFLENQHEADAAKILAEYARGYGEGHQAGKSDCAHVELALEKAEQRIEADAKLLKDCREELIWVAEGRGDSEKIDALLAALAERGK